MMKTTIVIPNYNGMKYLPDCLEALREDMERTGVRAQVMVVDNGSGDGSAEWVSENCPAVLLVRLRKNTGFCGAVNVGIRRAQTPYVLLLNNDTRVKTGFIKAMEEAVASSDRVFSVSARMLDMRDETLIDNAGDLYCALGWAFARGKGKKAERYDRRVPVFSSCGGAAIYKKEILDKIGLFDENHFAYLEDVDIGWRARIFGYENLYEPRAEVLHAGSAVSGSKYNRFKAGLSSANSVYIIYKNMPFFMVLLNLPFLAAGYLIKTLFFVRLGLGGVYLKGCARGVKRCLGEEGRRHKVRFRAARLGDHCKIQLALWANLARRAAECSFLTNRMT